mgnify:CR=1 FL=1
MSSQLRKTWFQDEVDDMGNNSSQTQPPSSDQSSEENVLPAKERMEEHITNSYCISPSASTLLIEKHPHFLREEPPSSNIIQESSVSIAPLEEITDNALVEDEQLLANNSKQLCFPNILEEQSSVAREIQPNHSDGIYDIKPEMYLNTIRTGGALNNQYSIEEETFLFDTFHHLVELNSKLPFRREEILAKLRCTIVGRDFCTSLDWLMLLANYITSREDKTSGCRKNELQLTFA